MRRLVFLALACATLALAQDKPNILWITAEDHGQEMGCYGDKFATTPNVDALAAKGMIFRNAWSTAPVCAPARTTIISGVYPPSSGGQHMRSLTRLPEDMKMYPVYLKEAGYYVTNNSKEDYNLEKTGEVWDESSREAHWKKRPKGKPFFAIFNSTVSHESQIRTRPHKQIHDPAKVRVPAYHPDTPEVRQDWAQYYDKVTEADAIAGQQLKELADAGLADDTIVFYYGDHGSGMPRSKRWPYNSGLQVPMVVYFPPKWEHLAPPEYRAGGASSRMVGFIDLAPTLLSIAGVKPPGFMQGHAFAGKYVTEMPDYLYGFRGRMDERYDMVRSIRDERYIYIRNFKPHRIYGQFISYMFQTPTTKLWFEMFGANKLTPAQRHFWEEKPSEELYDLLSDRDEVNNLAAHSYMQPVVERMSRALQDWQVKIRDLGFLPEGEMHVRAAGGAPYSMGHDDYRFPMKRVMQAAQAASDRNGEGSIRALHMAFRDPDSAVRYWAATGALIRKQDGVRAFHLELNNALVDESPFVRIAAAEALGRFGTDFEAERALAVLMQLAPMDKNSIYVSMEALNAIDYMDERAASAKAAIAALPRKADGYDRKFSAYVPNVIDKILSDLGG
ncbi:MAG: sulfatase-like hydrolase/transferase [Bryobacterales bacterium]|nr:sulfatase-like hydrolase/transferase [Bryobacterales bacterium]